MIFDDKKFVGRKIKEYRKKANLTQEELAEKVGLCEKHIGQIERGAYLPTLSNFFKIINILRIDLSEFGYNVNSESLNPTKKELIKIIYEINEKQLELYNKLIKDTYHYFSKY